MFYLNHTRFTVQYNKIIFNSLLVLTFLWLHSSLVTAAPFYAELAVARAEANVAGTHFKLIGSKVKFGYVYKPQVLLELQYNNAMNVEKANSNLSVNSIRALYLKLGSNDDIKLRLFFLLGYAEMDLETTGSNAVSAVYGAFSWGVVFERSVWTKNNFVTLEYNSFYDNSDVDMSAINLGYKYAF